MKSVKSLIALALMAGAAAPALAASVDVKVTGTISPAACTPILSGGGVIDYGNIPVGKLSKSDYTLLDEKQVSFAITCTAPSKVAIKATNNRPGTLAGASEGAAGAGNAPVSGIFGASANEVAAAGLGLAGNAKIGGYALRLAPETLRADGVAVDGITRDTDTAEWAQATSGSIYNSATVRQLSWAVSGTTTPISFRAVTGKLGIQAYINKVSELDLSQPVTLDGQTTLELVYL